MDTPTISMTSCGHSLNSSVTSYGHSPRVSVALIGRISKKKLKLRMKQFFHSFDYVHRDPEVCLHYIFLDGSSCETPLKFQNTDYKNFLCIFQSFLCIIV